MATFYMSIKYILYFVSLQYMHLYLLVAYTVPILLLISLNLLLMHTPKLKLTNLQSHKAYIIQYIRMYAYESSVVLAKALNQARFRNC